MASAPRTAEETVLARRPRTTRRSRLRKGRRGSKVSMTRRYLQASARGEVGVRRRRSGRAARPESSREKTGKAKGPAIRIYLITGPFVCRVLVAGAGFEPTTSGL